MKKINIACIIDDDPIFVFGTKRIMHLSNFSESIVVYENGKEAYEKLRATILANEPQPDVIFLDLNMPIWDGWQFLEELTKIPNDYPITIYIITSSVDPADVEKAKKYDVVNRYIVKPITNTELQEILENYS
ncbi:response regulator [Flavobacterium sp.]|uniref:response regulator n=1 Tax=Flavobacterium sp. TaxID=239 RepID=UPI002608D247|nr:response regulator [Flavobacterium sp.]MDG2432160.1 response regulator [Flavobacterium sp.]